MFDSNTPKCSYMELNSDTVNNKEFLLSEYFLFLELEFNAHNIERNAEHIRKEQYQSSRLKHFYCTSLSGEN